MFLQELARRYIDFLKLIALLTARFGSNFTVEEVRHNFPSTHDIGFADQNISIEEQ